MRNDEHHRESIYTADDIKNLEITNQPEPELDIVLNDLAVVSESDSFEMGAVIGCSKLNVRKEPSTSAEVICVLNASSEVVIDKQNSTDMFYKVCTSAGIEGFCMKKFIVMDS